jgi:hypothetical protein
MTIGPDGESDELPVPARTTAAGEFPAVLVTVSVPVAVSDAVGVNATFTVRLWSAFNVTGRATPVDANGPETVMALTVIEPELLLFVTITVWAVLVAPAATLPKFKLVGATVITGGPGEEEAPVPTRATVVGEFPAVLVIVSVPVAAPDAVGVNVTFSVRPWPAFNATGRVTPLDANGPETVMALTVVEPELLLFVTITAWAVLVAPTVTLPRYKLVGSTASVSGAPGAGDVAWPTQLERLTADKSTAAKMRDANLVLVRTDLTVTAKESIHGEEGDRSPHTRYTSSEYRLALRHVVRWHAVPWW